MNGLLEFISVCFAPVNVPYTLAFGVVLIYWIMFVVGAVGLDVLDMDIDLDGDMDFDIDADVATDVDVDVDTDVDVDAKAGSGGASGGGNPGVWISVLKFFNVGDVPMMVLASVLVFTMWASSVLWNFYWNPSGTGFLAALCFVPNFVFSALTTKVVTTPVRSLFRHANAGIEAPRRMVGKTCVVTTREVTPKFGQAQLVCDGPPITLNVRSRVGETLVKGDEAVIANHDEDLNTYLVIPFDLEVK